MIHGAGRQRRASACCCSAAIPDRAAAVAALALFAAATACSMAVLSSLFGYALTRGPVLRRLLALTPVLGAASLAFGA